MNTSSIEMCAPMGLFESNDNDNGINLMIMIMVLIQ